MPHPIRTGLLALLLAPWLMTQVGAAPDALPVPDGDVVLTVTGDIAVANSPGAAQFDLGMLESLGPETIQTTTIWTDGVQVFTGVPLYRLLDRLGVTDGVLEARAINDYTAEIPLSDAVPGGPLIAWQRNADLMTVRDRGPLWIIYPYDSSGAFRTETHYSRSIWQLERINVHP